MGLWRRERRERSFLCDVCGADAGERTLFAQVRDPNRIVASRSSAMGRRLNGKRIVQACSPEHLHQLQRQRIDPEDWLLQA